MKRTTEEEKLLTKYRHQTSDKAIQHKGESIDTLKSEIILKNTLLQKLRRQIMETGIEKETHDIQCRRIISLCCGVRVDEVDGILASLLQACESDG